MSEHRVRKLRTCRTCGKALVMTSAQLREHEHLDKRTLKLGLHLP